MKQYIKPAVSILDAECEEVMLSGSKIENMRSDAEQLSRDAIWQDDDNFEIRSAGAFE